MATLPHIFSFSQLGVYQDCGTKYKRYYLDNDKRKEIGQSMEIGTLVHECIERFYLGEFLSVHAAFPIVMTEYLDKLGLTAWQNELDHISNIVSNLMLRASAQYIGLDAIRTADGKVPSAPERTKTWKDELRKHNLEHRIDAANASILRLLPNEWSGVKMATIYSEVDHLTKMYVHPASIAEVKAIEFAFSDPDYKGDPNHADPNQREAHIKNLATLPSGRVFRGYLDLVGKLYNGQWVIVDHKTSAGDPPSELKVKHHEQLLLYAYFWHQLTGHWPDKIAINHIRTNTLVMADVDPALAIEAAQRHDELIRAIDKKIFLKHAPFAYGSPCVGRDATLEGACVYLPQCHREVAKGLGWIDPEEVEVQLPTVEGLGLNDQPVLTGDTY